MTAIPSNIPDALTSAFATDVQKQQQWRAFVAGVAHDPGPLVDVSHRACGISRAQRRCRIDDRIEPVQAAGWRRHRRMKAKRAQTRAVFLPGTSRHSALSMSVRIHNDTKPDDR